MLLVVLGVCRQVQKMRVLSICVLLALVATVASQGFFQALANLFGNNNNNNNRGGRGGGGGGSRYPQYLDTSDGRYAKFNGPVRGIPRDHGGGRFGMNCVNKSL